MKHAIAAKANNEIAFLFFRSFHALCNSFCVASMLCELKAQGDIEGFTHWPEEILKDMNSCLRSPMGIDDHTHLEPLCMPLVCSKEAGMEVSCLFPIRPSLKSMDHI